jgi:hypothetical protein
MRGTGHKPAVKLRDLSFPSLLCGNPRDQPGPGCTGRGDRRGAGIKARHRAARGAFRTNVSPTQPPHRIGNKLVSVVQSELKQ